MSPASLAGMAAAVVGLQVLAQLLPVRVAYGLVYGVALVAAAGQAWACRRRARAATGRVARGWWAGGAHGVFSLIVYFMTCLATVTGDIRDNSLALLPAFGAVLAIALQLGWLARPHRGGLARLTRVLDTAAVVAALAAVSWLWVVVPVLPEMPQLAPMAFLFVVVPYLLLAAWGLVLSANTPARPNGYAAQVLSCAATCSALGAVLSMHSAFLERPLFSYGGAAVAVLPNLLGLLATTQDVPDPEHSARRAVSLLWFAVPLMPVVLSLVAVVAILGWEGRLSMLLVCTLLGLVGAAILRQFVTLVVIRRLVLRLDEQRDDLDHLAHHDMLTGLPNRSSFRTQAAGMLADARPDNMTAVMLLDLDGFKAVNDTHGHAAGDNVLVTVGQRLTAVVRPSDVASRLGGDEFVVLLSGLTNPGDAERIANRIIERIGQPVAHQEISLRVGVSVGIALASGPDDDLDAVLHYADGALYAAKAAGKNTFRWHGTGVGEAATSARLP